MKKVRIEPLQWIKENAKIFLDQNIHCSIFEMLKKDGYKQIYNVFSINYVGANDGKLLNIIRDKDMILVTFDKKFNKMALKYDKKISILVKHETKDGRTTEFIGNKTIKNRIQNTLIHNFSLIKEYYEKK